MSAEKLEVFVTPMVRESIKERQEMMDSGDTDNSKFLYLNFFIAASFSSDIEAAEK
jgi:hypothetical protein